MFYAAMSANAMKNYLRALPGAAPCWSRRTSALPVQNQHQTQPGRTRISAGREQSRAPCGQGAALRLVSRLQRTWWSPWPKDGAIGHLQQAGQARHERGAGVRARPGDQSSCARFDGFKINDQRSKFKLLISATYLQPVLGQLKSLFVTSWQGPDTRL